MQNRTSGGTCEIKSFIPSDWLSDVYSQTAGCCHTVPMSHQVKGFLVPHWSIGMCLLNEADILGEVNSGLLFLHLAFPQPDLCTCEQEKQPEKGNKSKTVGDSSGDRCLWVPYLVSSFVLDFHVALTARSAGKKTPKPFQFHWNRHFCNETKFCGSTEAPQSMLLAAECCTFQGALSPPCGGVYSNPHHWNGWGRATWIASRKAFWILQPLLLLNPPFSQTTPTLSCLYGPPPSLTYYDWQSLGGLLPHKSDALKKLHPPSGQAATPPGVNIKYANFVVGVGLWGKGAENLTESSQMP